MKDGKSYTHKQGGPQPKGQPGVGPKHKTEGMSLKNGLIDQAKFDHHMPPRYENNEMEQRPVADNKTVSSDRGSFPSKC